MAGQRRVPPAAPIIGLGAWRSGVNEYLNLGEPALPPGDPTSPVPLRCRIRSIVRSIRSPPSPHWRTLQVLPPLGPLAEHNIRDDLRHQPVGIRGIEAIDLGTMRGHRRVAAADVGRPALP